MNEFHLILSNPHFACRTGELKEENSEEEERGNAEILGAVSESKETPETNSIHLKVSHCNFDFVYSLFVEINDVLFRLLSEGIRPISSMVNLQKFRLLYLSLLDLPIPPWRRRVRRALKVLGLDASCTKTFNTSPRLHNRKVVSDLVYTIGYLTHIYRLATATLELCHSTLTLPFRLPSVAQLRLLLTCIANFRTSYKPRSQVLNEKGMLEDTAVRYISKRYYHSIRHYPMLARKCLLRRLRNLRPLTDSNSKRVHTLFHIFTHDSNNLRYLRSYGCNLVRFYLFSKHCSFALYEDKRMPADPAQTIADEQHLIKLKLDKLRVRVISEKRVMAFPTRFECVAWDMADLALLRASDNTPVSSVSLGEGKYLGAMYYMDHANRVMYLSYFTQDRTRSIAVRAAS
jgi:hypothetical protein